MQMIDEGFVGGLRKYSAIALLLLGSLNTAWVMSPELHGLLSPEAMIKANMAMAWVGFVLRFVKQARAAVEQQQ